VTTMEKPIADVFTWPADEPKLIGARCTECAAVTFPSQSRCPRCSTSSMEDLELPTRGTLVSWTTQGFPPAVDYMNDPTGASFVPFGVGLVQLGDVVRVESRLTENDPDKLDFGMDVELTVIPFYTDENGDEIVTFAFAPTGA
jgi:uncharacterized protein